MVETKGKKKQTAKKEENNKSMTFYMIKDARGPSYFPYFYTNQQDQFLIAESFFFLNRMVSTFYFQF